MTYDFLTVYIPQDSASSKTVKTYRDGLTIFRRYVAEVKGFSIRSFSFSQCTFECCHVQYRRNRKSQQSECVPVSLHSTTLYAGLQKWARRYRKAVTVEQLYKGTLLQIDWCWKSNTRTPWTTAYLRRRIPRQYGGLFIVYGGCLLSFWNIDDFVTGVKFFSLAVSHFISDIFTIPIQLTIIKNVRLPAKARNHIHLHQGDMTEKWT